jgi:hypothetical protein
MWGYLPKWSDLGLASQYNFVTGTFKRVTKSWMLHKMKRSLEACNNKVEHCCCKKNSGRT